MNRNAMLHVYAEKLGIHLQKSLYLCYFLFGNDPFLLQESQNLIQHRAQEEQFNEHFIITLDINTNWEKIFNLCQTRSLFSNRQILILYLPFSNFQENIDKQLLWLSTLLHKDLLLIFRGNKLSHLLKKSAWFKELSNQAVVVSCFTPEHDKLLHWIIKRAKSMKLILEEDACKMLYHCYEGNLIALVQGLEKLLLVYPNDKKLTLQQVRSVINNTTRFTVTHWVNAVLAGKSERAIHILNQLELDSIEPVILLRNIQREVFQLLTLKRKMAVLSACTSPLEYHRVCKNDNNSPSYQASKPLTLLQLRDVIAFMTKIELSLKRDYSYPIWANMKTLSLLLCGKTLPQAILYD